MNTKKKINRLRFGRLLAVAVLVLTSAVVASSASAATHKIQRPKLKRGSLNIEGTRASDKIALRLKAGNARILQVDVGDDGKADFSFKRKQIARISVHAGSGNDLVRIDERNGVFTARIKTLLDGGAGNDTLIGGAGAETLLGGAGNRPGRRKRRQRSRPARRRRRLLRLGSRRRERQRRRRSRHRHDGLQRRGCRGARHGVRERDACQVRPRHRQRDDGPRRTGAGRLRRSRRARRRSPSTI